MAATSFASPSLVKRAILAFAGPTNKLPYSSSPRRFPLRTTPLSFSAFGFCHLTQAIKGETDVFLRGAGDKGGLTEDVKNIIEMAKRASLRREVLHTDFLTPPILKESVQVIEKLADITAVVQGGYPEAERCRLSVGHPEDLTTAPDVVAALSVSGNFSFQPCSHVDFLGSILGTGIARDTLGDILLQGEKGAHILVVPELADFLTLSLDKVRNVPVTCKKMPLIALEYEPPRTKSFRTVEASLRIDAVASAGYKISRSKLVGLISSGDVRVNWTTVTKNNTYVKSGDIISVSGQGRLKVSSGKSRLGENFRGPKASYLIGV